MALADSRNPAPAARMECEANRLRGRAGPNILRHRVRFMTIKPMKCDLGSVVITTIQPPTTAVGAMLAKATSFGLDMIVIGDRKTPDGAWAEGQGYYSISRQVDSGVLYAGVAPLNHYARKNIGYLIAIANGTSVIFDTDDDNAPLETWTRRKS